MRFLSFFSLKSRYHAEGAYRAQKVRGSREVRGHGTQGNFFTKTSKTPLHGIPQTRKVFRKSRCIPLILP